jgi:hypothetical protein
MAFRRMQVFRTKDNLFLGYLSCDTVNSQRAWVTNSAVMAYNYDWMSYSDGRWRLDQETDGGNRSLTYDAVLTDDWWEAVWGLADNWIYLTLGADGSVMYSDGNVSRMLRVDDHRMLFFLKSSDPEGPTARDWDGKPIRPYWNVSLGLVPEGSNPNDLPMGK